MKFQPMTPKMRNAPMFGKPFSTPLSKKGRKKIKANTENKPVLTIGTIKLAMIRPIRLFLFLNNLKRRPAHKPANVVFNKHARTVPKGLIGMNSPRVDGESNAIKPLKKPNIAPDKGPYNTAAKTIVINDRLILTGPNCR